MEKIFSLIGIILYVALLIFIGLKNHYGLPPSNFEIMIVILVAIALEGRFIRNSINNK